MTDSESRTYHAIRLVGLVAAAPLALLMFIVWRLMGWVGDQ